MTEVVTLGIFGNEAGMRVQQICLAHAYGLTPEDNAKYTIRAVQNLLSGIDIDGYYMVDYSAVPVLTDALGGVPVKIEFDMTSVNPEWKQGSSVTLRGKAAETFVRARKTVGEGTNEERMVRQAEFMRSAINQMRQKINNDIGYAETLVETLQGLSVTNMTTKRLAEELKEIHGYEVLPVDHPAGEYTIGSDGFVEFHMQDGAAVEWVLEHLFSETK
jgi:anionic cell wall polymer biosynthesis LytR-Cps2A-Psr (LCP) family protein